MNASVNDGTIEVTDNQDGTYSFTMPDEDVNVSAVILDGDTCYFDEASSTLHLRGNVRKSDVRKYSNNYSNYDTRHVIAEEGAVLPADCDSLFHYYENVESIDLSNADSPNVTNMNHMFNYCSALTDLTLGESFNTAKVTEMEYMFSNCQKLTSIDLSRFDTSEVTDMSNMSENCENLTSLDLTSFLAESLTKDQETGSSGNLWMFSNSSSLAKINESKIAK